jgi:hypothetical protein
MGNKTLNRIISKEQIKESALCLYRNGLPKGFSIGLSEVDDLIRWETGRLSVVTGVPNFGKSEFIDFMLVQLNNLHGWKTLYFSPENYPVGYHLQKLVSKISGKPFDRNKLTETELYNTVSHISNNFFFLNYETVDTLDDILICAEQLIHEEGIKVMVIDPYNRLEHHRPSNLTETEYISKLLDRLSNFAKRYNILIHLVAHPRKIQCKDGVFDVPNYYDINGSANFANKADYCLAVHRDKLNMRTEIHIQKVKFKNLGCQGIAYLKYNIDTGNYYEENLGLPALDFSMPQQKEERGKDEQLVEQIQTYLNRNVLDVPVSYYTSVTNKEGQQTNLYSFLKNKDNDIDLDTMRQQPDFKEKKLSLPAVTVSGLFAGNHKTENLKKHSGLICIDIDEKEQIRGIDTIFNELKQLNNIAYLGRSCSGKGLFGIIPIKEPQKHLAHFLALEKDLAGREIIIDKSGKDITRLRFYSYDPDAYYNINAETYTSLYSPPVKEHQYNNMVITVDDKKLTDAIKDIQDNHINIAESYDEWRDLAIIFNNELGEEGRKLFHAVSSQSSKYDEGESDDLFDKIGSYGYQEKGIGSFYYMYDEAKK